MLADEISCNGWASDRSQENKCCSKLKMWATVSLTGNGPSQPMFWP